MWLFLLGVVVGALVVIIASAIYAGGYNDGLKRKDRKEIDERF